MVSNKIIKKNPIIGAKSNIPTGGIILRKGAMMGSLKLPNNANAGCNLSLKNTIQLITNDAMISSWLRRKKSKTSVIPATKNNI